MTINPLTIATSVVSKISSAHSHGPDQSLQTAAKTAMRGASSGAAASADADPLKDFMTGIMMQMIIEQMYPDDDDAPDASPQPNADVF